MTNVTDRTIVPVVMTGSLCQPLGPRSEQMRQVLDMIDVLEEGGEVVTISIVTTIIENIFLK